MIDDHPSMIEGYKSILSFNDFDVDIKTKAAYNCESAYKIIMETEDRYTYDFAFVDLSLPAYQEKQINSGEDLALLIKRRFPSCKIVILTSHAEAFLLDKIIKTIDPKGLLVKSDFTADEFLSAFEQMLNNQKYISKTVKENVSELHSQNILLDEYNRELIILLGKGIKSKNLPNYINLSMSAIDKRKAQIKVYFKIEKGGTDEDIIREAKRHGLI